MDIAYVLTVIINLAKQKKNYPGAMPPVSLRSSNYIQFNVDVVSSADHSLGSTTPNLRIDISPFI